MIAETRRRGGRKPLPMIQRFASKIEIGPRREDCWLWTGSKVGGYGQMSGRGRRGANPLRAHRVSYELFKGPIPPNAFVCHACDVPACVNPAHLWVGDCDLNARDRCAKARGSTRLTESAVREMLKQHAAGMSCRAIARKHGVSHVCAANVCARRSWSHIKEVA